MKSGRGGKRAGAGRPLGNKTKLFRLEESYGEYCKDNQRMIEKLPKLMEKLNEWKDKEQEASKTSPRWQKLREMLSEIDSLIAISNIEKKGIVD